MHTSVEGKFRRNFVSFIIPKDYFELGKKMAPIRLFLGPKQPIFKILGQKLPKS